MFYPSPAFRTQIQLWVFSTRRMGEDILKLIEATYFT